MYSETFRKLLSELPNRGELEGTRHIGFAENPVCGDAARIFLRIDRGRIQEAKFQASGCAACIASTAAVTLLIGDRDLRSCRSLTVPDLLEFLGGLPRHKRHGAEVAIEALRAALSPPQSD